MTHQSDLWWPNLIQQSGLVSQDHYLNSLGPIITGFPIHAYSDMGEPVILIGYQLPKSKEVIIDWQPETDWLIKAPDQLTDEQANPGIHCLKECLAFAHFMQLGWYLLRTFCNFNCALISHPNQEQLVISVRETMTCMGNCACAMKSVTFSLILHLNVVQNSFFKCTL